MRQELAFGTAPPGERFKEPGEFDSMFEGLRPRVFRFMLASLRDREAAENLTQDCFVRAFQARAQFRGTRLPRRG